MQEKKQFIEIAKNDSLCQDDQEVNSPALLKFWEIDLKCPVVGMCLTFSEQKRLLRKAGFSIKMKSPFEIHETLLACSEKENILSRRIDNMLNRKFGDEAVSLLELDLKEFMSHCKAAFETGDCIGVLWAAAARSDLPAEYRRELFGIIHMDMHWSAEQNIRLRQDLTSQKKELSRMRQGIKEVIRGNRTLKKENERLRRDKTELKARLASAEIEKARFKEELSELKSQNLAVKLDQENQGLKNGLDALFGELKERKRQVASLIEQTRQLSAELERQREENRRIRKEAQEIIEEFFTLKRCDESCPSFDLCKKRVLIIGGITRMESLYRQLIEGNGGIFDYHNGYIKRGLKNLECRFRRADVVLCPVSCNSHAACSIIKNLGKKHNKPVHMLANSSLNAISQVIWNVDKDQITLN